MAADNGGGPDDERGDGPESLSPPDLADRGAGLWLEVTKAGQLDAAGRVLLHEACRVTDRLEQLARILAGDADVWARIETERGGDLVLAIDDAMTEARQQQTTLRLLLGQLGLGKLAAAPAQKGSDVDELRARRAERAAAAAAALRT